MNLRVLPFASILTLALAGAACSESTSTDPVVETPPAAKVTTASAPVDDGFNLMVPSDDPMSGPVNDGFNLPMTIPTDAPANDGFNLPNDLPTSGGLATIPEIDTSILEEEPEPEVEDVDAIIRLP